MIGIFGGTFDPIHFGHLRPALEVLQDLGLDEVRLLPAGQPPHRQRPAADAAQRLALVRLAVGDQPGLRVDDREVRRQGPSYMVDTLASLRAECGTVPLCLILGFDAFLGLPRWHRWRELEELAHLVVMTRPGAHADLEDALAAMVERCRVGGADALRGRPAGGLLFHPVSQLDISASAIRAQLAAGRSPRWLLPDAVLERIRRDGIYACGPAGAGQGVSLNSDCGEHADQ